MSSPTPNLTLGAPTRPERAQRAVFTLQPLTPKAAIESLRRMALSHPAGSHERFVLMRAIADVTCVAGLVEHGRAKGTPFFKNRWVPLGKKSMRPKPTELGKRATSKREAAKFWGLRRAVLAMKK